jgi:hypothetical protein
MFGFLKSKSERAAMAIERLMLTMEAAADKGNWDVAAYSAQKMLVPLREMNESGEWSEEDLQKFLQRRGLVKQVRDPAYAEWLRENMPMF